MESTAKKVRQSNFEALRIVAMFMIVLYHIYLGSIQPNYPVAFNTAIFLPLHIGVPLFVLTSGYFGIRISGKSFAQLLGRMLVYTIPSETLYLLVKYIVRGGGLHFTVNN